jgi:tryptophanyl-tRNA synthetase
VTDSGSEVKGGEEKPALTNLLTIYSELSGKSVTELEKMYEGKGYGDFKIDLGEVIVEWMTPIQQRIEELMQEPEQLDSILNAGRDKAHSVANSTLKRVYNTVGLGY